MHAIYMSCEILDEVILLGVKEGYPAAEERLSDAGLAEHAQNTGRMPSGLHHTLQMIIRM